MFYLLAALGCLVFTYRASRTFWWIIAGILILIGLSSISNLLQEVTTMGRSFAYANGWYRARRPLQELGIASIPVISIMICLGMLLRSGLKRLHAAEWLALIGMVALLNLIIIRAISLHDIDYLLGRQLFGMRLNMVFELLILLCIVAAALWAGRRALAQQPDSTVS